MEEKILITLEIKLDILHLFIKILKSSFLFQYILSK